MAMIKREKYLKVLNLGADASQDEIKKAYKELALQLHPDKNQHDPDATERFQELSEAYTYLSRPEQDNSDNDDGDDEYFYFDDDEDGDKAYYYYEEDHDLINLLLYFQALREGRGQSYSGHCSCGQDHSHSGASIFLNRQGGVRVEFDSDEDEYGDDSTRPAKTYSSRYLQRSSEFNEAEYARKKAEAANEEANSKRRKKKKKDAEKKNGTQEVPVEEPKKKSKKELMQEQKRREKEMAEIAAKLAEKNRLAEEKERKRIEKEQQRREEMSKARISPAPRQRKKSVADKDVEGEIESQLKRNERERLEKERILQEAQKKPKSKKKKKKKNQNQPQECASVESSPKRESSDNQEIFMEEPQPLNDKFEYPKPRGHSKKWQPPPNPDTLLINMGTVPSKAPKNSHAAQGNSKHTSHKTDVRPKQKSPPVQSFSGWTAPNVPPRFQKQKQQQQQQQQQQWPPKQQQQWPPKQQQQWPPKQQQQWPPKQPSHHHQQQQEEESWDPEPEPVHRPPVISAPPAPPPARNVWAERQKFVAEAMPTDASEEEAMLRAALEMSRLEAEALELARKIEEQEAVERSREEEETRQKYQHMSLSDPPLASAFPTAKPSYSSAAAMSNTAPPHPKQDMGASAWWAKQPAAKPTPAWSQQQAQKGLDAFHSDFKDSKSPEGAGNSAWWAEKKSSVSSEKEENAQAQEDSGIHSDTLYTPSETYADSTPTPSRDANPWNTPKPADSTKPANSTWYSSRDTQEQWDEGVQEEEEEEDKKFDDEVYNSLDEIDSCSLTFSDGKRSQDSTPGFGAGGGASVKSSSSSEHHKTGFRPYVRDPQLPQQNTASAWGGQEATNASNTQAFPAPTSFKPVESFKSVEPQKWNVWESANRATQDSYSTSPAYPPSMPTHPPSLPTFPPSVPTKPSVPSHPPSLPSFSQSVPTNPPSLPSFPPSLPTNPSVATHAPTLPSFPPSLPTTEAAKSTGRRLGRGRSFVSSLHERNGPGRAPSTKPAGISAPAVPKAEVAEKPVGGSGRGRGKAGPNRPAGFGVSSLSNSSSSGRNSAESLDGGAQKLATGNGATANSYPPHNPGEGGTSAAGMWDDVDDVPLTGFPGKGVSREASVESNQSAASSASSSAPQPPSLAAPPALPTLADLSAFFKMNSQVPNLLPLIPLTQPGAAGDTQQSMYAPMMLPNMMPMPMYGLPFPMMPTQQMPPNYNYPQQPAAAPQQQQQQQQQHASNNQQR